MNGQAGAAIWPWLLFETERNNRTNNNKHSLIDLWAKFIAYYVSQGKHFPGSQINHIGDT